MNAQRSERCEFCTRVKGIPGSKKRPPRYCWQTHDDACRAAELWHLRYARAALELARELISTPRGTPEHLEKELQLVRALAVIDTQVPPTVPDETTAELVSTPEI